MSGHRPAGYFPPDFSVRTHPSGPFRPDFFLRTHLSGPFSPYPFRRLPCIWLSGNVAIPDANPCGGFPFLPVFSYIRLKDNCSYC